MDKKILAVPLSRFRREIRSLLKKLDNKTLTEIHVTKHKKASYVVTSLNHYEELKTKEEELISMLDKS